MESIINSIAEYITNAKYSDLPDNVVSCAKERALDILSAGIAGANLWEYADAIVNAYVDMEFEGSSTIIGRKETMSFPAAATINCAYAHSVELDDGHRNAGIHAGTVVVPTALALAEKYGKSGCDSILAIVLGYDVAYRFARNMTPALINKGFHPSSVCGTMGATAAAASLIQLNSNQTAYALSLSALHAAGLMEVTHSGQAAKGAMVGHAAFAGIASAMMAKHGIVAPDASFGGSSGLLQAMSTDVVVNKIVENLGSMFEILDTYVKLYPTCRHTHAPIEGVISLREEHGIQFDEVKEITVGTYPIAYKLTGSAQLPDDIPHARFSTPYCVAVALKNGSFGLGDLNLTRITDKKLQELSLRVHVYVDEKVAAEFPQKRGAKIQIILNNGREFEKTLFGLKGSPEKPISFDDLCIKFKNMATPLLTNKKIANICKNIKNMHKITNMQEFMQELKINN